MPALKHMQMFYDRYEIEIDDEWVKFKSVDSYLFSGQEGDP